MLLLDGDACKSEGGAPMWKSLSTAMTRLSDNLLTSYIYRHPRIQAGSGLIVRGLPLIEISESNQIVIGQNVLLNSRRAGYHVSMHSPTKLMADGRAANIEIGSKTRIHGTCIHAKQHIRIGERCLIAANTTIIDENGHATSPGNVTYRLDTRGEPRPVTIEDDVWIGMNCLILPGTVVGRGSVIAAGLTIRGHIPEYSLVRQSSPIITPLPGLSQNER